MKIIYFGFSQPHNSVDGVYIKGLKENGAEVTAFFYPNKGYRRYAAIRRDYKANQRGVDLVMVGYASPQAVIWLRLFCFKKIVFNALCSEYERKVVSRRLVGDWSIKAWYYWLLDFVACRLAQLLMVESQHQIDYFIKLFKLSPNKLFLARTGVDDRKFYYHPNLSKFEQFTVLFRGRLLPEAGAEVAVRAAKELEGQGARFLMLASGLELSVVQKLIAELQPNNLELITEFLPEEKLRETMQGAHLSLGQLSDHDRLQRTIPHKAYESLAMKLPYLTARNPAVMELLTEDETCLAFKPADSHDLAEKILWAKNHPAELDRISAAAYHLYQTQLTSKILAWQLLGKLKK